MSKRLRICLEEQLEVDKLYEAEQQAKRSGEFDQLYQQTQTEQEMDKLDEDNPEDADMESSDGSEESVETTDESTDAEVSEEEVPAQEALRQLSFQSVATEDFDGVKNFVGSGIHTVANLAYDVTKYLVQLGIDYGPGIASKLYKGVTFVFGKLAKLLVVSLVSVTTYLQRHSKSLEKIRDDIVALQRTLDSLEPRDEPVDLSQVKFTHQKAINHLKIEDNTDFEQNVQKLTQFVDSVVKSLDTNIRNDVSSIKHLVALSMTGISKSPSNFMKIKPLSLPFSHGAIEGYEAQSDAVADSHYAQLLPGDVVFLARLPKEDVNDLDELTKAYNDSTLFFGIDSSKFKEIESVDYMTAEKLKSFLGSLETLCNLCIEHRTLYENVKKLKKGLQFSFKSYFHSLASSKDKVSMKSSLIEYIYLKSMFIDKVYLVAAMDVHDYAAKILTYGLSFSKDNLKKLT